jgi:hypothetical protein
MISLGCEFRSRRLPRQREGVLRPVLAGALRWDSGEAIVEELLDLAIAVISLRGGEFLVEKPPGLLAFGATSGGRQGGGLRVAASKPLPEAESSAEGVGHDQGRLHAFRP